MWVYFKLTFFAFFIVLKYNVYGDDYEINKL